MCIKWIIAEIKNADSYLNVVYFNSLSEVILLFFLSSKMHWLSNDVINIQYKFG